MQSLQWGPGVKLEMWEVSRRGERLKCQRKLVRTDVEKYKHAIDLNSRALSVVLIHLQ